MHKNILKLQNHIKNRKSRNSNHFITHVTCGIPYLKYLYIYTYRHARYAICTYTWHTGMHQTRHGNYCSHACDFGIAQASMETMIVEFAMYWQEAPSVEAGVLLAEWYRSTNRCSLRQPSQQPIKLTASARIKEETHTSKEGKAGLQTAPLHRHTPWCYL